MKTRASLLLICLMGYGLLNSYGQNPDFKYKRKLNGITGTWHKVILENDIFEHSANDLSDIRILGIKNNQDTLEVPYILKITDEKHIKNQIPFKLINQSRNAKGRYYTFEITELEEINEIVLDFEEKNFDWIVDLEGSQNLNEWFDIITDYRILSIKNAITEYSFTSLKFPAATFKYFRLRIKTDKNPGLLEAAFFRNEVQPGKYRDYEIKSLKRSENLKAKQTVLDIHLSEYVPLSMIVPDIDKGFDFYRPVKVQCLIDSIKGPDGWNYSYQTIYSGMLSSFEVNKIMLDQQKASRIKIIIDNQDNTPLKINAVSISGNLYEFTCRFLEPATYYLFYGSSHLASPNYDIGYFSRKIPTDRAPVKLGAPTLIPKGTVASPQPLFSNKMWLWGLMILMIVLLGWFSLKMMKN